MTLFLQFEIGGHRYLIEGRSVAAVLPRPAFKALPGAPSGVAGVANYQGKPVPVVDLSEVATGRSAADRLSTRLVLVRYPSQQGERLLGIVAERATSVVRLDEKTFVNAGIEAAPWLGRVTPAGEGSLAQRITIEALLPPDLRAVLFQNAEEPA